MLTAPFHLVPRLRMSGATPLLLIRLHGVYREQLCIYSNNKCHGLIFVFRSVHKPFVIKSDFRVVEKKEK